MKKMRKNSGQALLIILLVMAVGLTIGLAVISRSVTDIGISRQEEESARVFSVAETGIEEALKAGGVPADVIVGGITARVTRSSLGEENEFAFPGEYEAGEVQTLWLVEHEDDGSLNLDNPPSRYSRDSLEVYWGKEDGEIVPALEVTLIYNQNGVKIMRWALDSDHLIRGNSFEGVDATGSFSVGGKNFKYKKTLSLPCDQSNLICYALRLRLLYNDQPEILGAKATSGNLPSQGVCYESTASKEEGGITRKVRHCQFYKSPPGIFDYVLYSEGDLIK